MREENKISFSGGNGEGVPPVPIPNTEVKPFCADGTGFYPGEQVAARKYLLQAPRDYPLGLSAAANKGSQGDFQQRTIAVVDGNLPEHTDSAVD